MSSPLDLRILTDRADLEALVPAWSELLSRSEQPQPTRTPQWLLTWWDTYGSDGGRELCVVTARGGDGGLVGIIPLLRRNIRRFAMVSVRTLEYIGSGEDVREEVFSEYLGPIIARGSESAVASQFASLVRRGKLGAWDELRLPKMLGSDPSVRLLAEALRTTGLMSEVERTHECPYLQLPASWDALLVSMDSRRRHYVRQTLRTFDEWTNGSEVRLVQASDAASVREGLAVLKSLHNERWREEGAFRTQRFIAFHEKLGTALSGGDGGRLDLAWLEVAGKPVAAIYNIIFDRKVYFYQSGRSLDVPKKVRVGIVMHLYAIQRAIAQGFAEYDFLAGQADYKRKLSSNRHRDLVTLRVWARTTRGVALAAFRGLIRRLRGRNVASQALLLCLLQVA